MNFPGKFDQVWNFWLHKPKFEPDNWACSVDQIFQSRSHITDLLALNLFFTFSKPKWACSVDQIFQTRSDITDLLLGIKFVSHFFKTQLSMLSRMNFSDQVTYYRPLYNKSVSLIFQTHRSNFQINTNQYPTKISFYDTMTTDKVMNSWQCFPQCWKKRICCNTSSFGCLILNFVNP